MKNFFLEKMKNVFKICSSSTKAIIMYEKGKMYLILRGNITNQKKNKFSYKIHSESKKILQVAHNNNELSSHFLQYNL